MKWNNIIKYINDWFVKLFVIIFVISLFIGIIITITKCNKPITPPVESHDLDSLSKVNDEIIIEIQTIDSIKNAKIIEVEDLDNDSTLKLFYQLIGK